MADSNRPDDVTRHLQALGEELRAMPSDVDRAARRLETAHPRASLWPAPVGIAAAILVFAGLLRLNSPASVEISAAPPPSLQMDGLTIVQYFAWKLDDRSVLVVWGFKNGDVGTPVRRQFDGYTEAPIRCDVAADGWAVCWSFFVADDGRNPQLSPPMLTPWSSHEPPIRFGVTAGPYQASELRDALRLTGSSARPLSVAELQNEIRRLGVERNLQS